MATTTTIQELIEKLEKEYIVEEHASKTKVVLKYSDNLAFLKECIDLAKEIADGEQE